ncbi:polysaccharide biosynthesis C-terminal domain-containing protein [Shewanella sp. 202IG2-18]|uniref:MATE family efflux transporter n=1 Tax=Parashewanella hymeniacidonis TaxID=2807618 RepID=UPI00195FA134|nr:MATE family efflux transporter [Parashewanella hymeniacidonis]MBM7074284.1 polysaccharide biosynthesis C-terminal domain-containing protein [Parashewanella hymeniacidonis]
MSTALSSLISRYKNSLATISIFILGGFTSICFNIYLSRTVGPSSYGNFKVAEAFFYFGGIIAIMGGASAAPKFLLSQVKNTQTNGSWHYVRFYSYLSLAVTLALGILVFIGHEYHISTFDGANYHPILIAVIIIPICAISNLLSSVLQSAEKLEFAFLPWAFGYTALSLLLCYIYNTYFGVLNELSAIRLSILVVCCLTVFSIFYINKFKLMPIKKAPSYLKPKTWLAISVPMMIATSLQYLMQKLDIFMIEYLADEIAVGHYAAAQSIDNVFYYIQLALIAIFSPKIAKSLSEPKEQQIKLITVAFKLCLLCCTPFAFLVVYFGHDLLMTYQHNTHLAYNSLIILLFGYILTALLSAGVVWLQYNGKSKVTMYLLLASTVINAVLNWLLIPILNIEGAAIATCIAMAVCIFGFCFFIQKELNYFNLKRAPVFN